MPATVTVTLTEDEVAYARLVGLKRQTWNEERRHKDAYGLDPDQALAVNVMGAGAELAVARHYGITWHAVVEDPWSLRGDVGAFEVRSVKATGHGCLILHPKDQATKADRPFILVVIDGNRYELAGWYRPDMGVDQRWWEVRRAGGGCYYVPRIALRPMDELPGPNARDCTRCALAAARTIRPYWDEDGHLCPACCEALEAQFDATDWPTTPWWEAVA